MHGQSQRADTSRFNAVEVPGTFDVESSYGETYGRVSNPFVSETSLCCFGYKHCAEPTSTEYFVREVPQIGDPEIFAIVPGEPDPNCQPFKTKREGDQGLVPLPIREDTTVLVGANIKFDLLWMFTRPDNKGLWEFFIRGGYIWDVSYAEYLLSGQAVSNKNHDPKYRCSLNSVAALNGIEYSKLDIVGGMWAEGIRTEDIPEDVLIEYQTRDVDLTYDVYVSQVRRAKELGVPFYNNLLSRMDGLFATTWMELNGLYVNKEKGLKIAEQMQQKANIMRSMVDLELPPLPDRYEFNVGSRTQLSAFLFGGTIKYEGRVPRTTKEGEPIYEQVHVPTWATEKKVAEPLVIDGVTQYFKRGKNAGKLKTVNVKHTLKPGEQQATYTSGRRKGELKFEKADHPDKLPQMKNGDMYFTFPSQGYSPVHKYAQFNENDEVTGYSTAEDHMKELKKLYPDWQVLTLVGELSALQKDLGTYYVSYSKEGKPKGMLTTVHPDGCIHHSLQHYITATGRLSCTKPNLQNVPGEDKSIVKSLMESRFGKYGSMLEIDYSQLEVVTKAAISRDRNLKKDLADGVCFHCVNLALAEHMEPWTVQRLAKGVDKDSPEKLLLINKGQHSKSVKVWKFKRKKIKPFTFPEKYGGGAVLMAESTGLTVDEVKAIIAAKKLRYPEEAEFDDNVLLKVKHTRTASPFRTTKGYPAGVGYYQCETGTVYAFIENDAPKWLQDRDHVYTSFKPTQTKNYPSQGLGGFIMEDAIGKVARWLLTRQELWPLLKMVNTVHDCQWLDAHNSVKAEVIPIIKGIMEDVNTSFNRMCGDLDWGVKFPAEVEHGPNMLHLKHYKGV